MARKRQTLESLVERLRPELRAAFLAGVASLRNDADVAAVIAALARGDVAAAENALRIDAAAFGAYRAQIASAFAQGGEFGVNSMPKRRPDGLRLVIRFDAADPPAEQWLLDHSSKAIRDIVDDQRVMTRRVLQEGLADGRNPRSVALDLVGKINKATGRREGGLIGLTNNQAKFVQSARNELAGGPEELNRYLGRKLRDKRFDRQVTTAIRTGRPIPADIRAKMVESYKNALLQFRGETIGRTEAMAALHQGRYEAFNQAVRKGEVKTQEVERTWLTAGDSRVRDSHGAMNGQTVGLNEPYITPNGARLMYPGDPSGPPEEIINCRCNEDIRINFLSRLKRPGG